MTVWLFQRDNEGRSIVGTPQLMLPMNVDQVGEIRLYRFVFPYLPPSKNVIDNWPAQWKQSAKKKWMNAIAEQCDAMMVPRGNAQVGLAATLVFPSHARRDPQNYAQQLWHWIPDGLVRAEVLVDDDEGRVQIGPNWGLKFQYDERKGIPKKRREKTLLALTMRVED